MSKNRSIETMTIDGDCASFNFVNTVHSRVEEDRFDYLNSYDDLIEWMGKVKLLPAEKLKDLKKLAALDNKAAQKALIKIKKQRELLYNFFSPVIHNKEPEESVVKNINKTLSDSLSALSFSYNKGELELEWKSSKVDLSEPLKIIFKDVFDIITTIPQNRLKECKACGWLFLDKSKNNSRTWCSMQTCGSIEKAKRYYYRKKENG
jgi:predicted RNA-binding Zn ribbon-like protein